MTAFFILWFPQIPGGIIVEIDLTKGLVTDKDRGFTLRAIPIPHFMIKILEEGGLVPHIKKHGDFCLD